MLLTLRNSQVNGSEEIGSICFNLKAIIFLLQWLPVSAGSYVISAPPLSLCRARCLMLLSGRGSSSFSVINFYLLCSVVFNFN